MHLVVIFEQHPERRIREYLGDSPFDLDRVFSHAFHPLKSRADDDFVEYIRPNKPRTLTRPGSRRYIRKR